MFYNGFPEYVSVADQKKRSLKVYEKLRKKNPYIKPVFLDSKVIAKTFWGKAWCEHLKSYADYENRLGRGRSYVRVNAVCHLEIEAGKITATVSGSSVYQMTIRVEPLSQTKWGNIKNTSAGKISTLLDILQGKLPKDLIHSLCDVENGLFPDLNDLTFSCSCPDDAQMCKHIAAALYGVGNRLDKEPELLFLLRQVNAEELLGSAQLENAFDNARLNDTQDDLLLENDDLGALFGIELDSFDEDEKNTTSTKKIINKPIKTQNASAKKQKNKSAIFAKGTNEPSKLKQRNEESDQKKAMQNKTKAKKSLKTKVIQKKSRVNKKIQTLVIKPKQAITNEAVFCCLCGKEYKRLTKTHLEKEHGISVEQYKEMCGYNKEQSLFAGALLFK